MIFFINFANFIDYLFFFTKYELKQLIDLLRHNFLSFKNFHSAVDFT